MIRTEQKQGAAASAGGAAGPLCHLLAQENRQKHKNEKKHKESKECHLYS